MNNLESIEEIDHEENGMNRNSQFNDPQNTPTSNYQKNLLREILRKHKIEANDEKYQQQTKVNQQNTSFKTLTNPMRRRSQSQYNLKFKQTSSDFSDDHLQITVPGSLIAKIKEQINIQPPNIIMRKCQTSQMKKRQRTQSQNSIHSHQSQQTQTLHNQLMQINNFQAKPMLSASTKNKINNEQNQREQNEKQQQNLTNEYYKANEQTNNLILQRKLNNRQLYMDIFLKKQQSLDVSSYLKENDQSTISKLQTQYVTPQKQTNPQSTHQSQKSNNSQLSQQQFIPNQPQSQIQQQYQQQSLQKSQQNQQQNQNNQQQQTQQQQNPSSYYQKQQYISQQYQQLQNQQYQQQNQQQLQLSQQQQSQDFTSINSADILKNRREGINANVTKALLSSRPSSNIKLRSNNVKGNKGDELIDAQDIIKLQNNYQSISIKERSPNTNAYYSSQKQSRSNSIQSGDIRFYQSEQEQPNIPIHLQKSIQILHKIISTESILSKLNQPYCRHSYYLEIQDQIKEMSQQLNDVYSDFLRDSSKNINELGFFSLFLSSLQKFFNEINSFISKVVIILPEQHAVDQMKNVKLLLEVISKMNSPIDQNNSKQSPREEYYDKKLQYIQELTLLPTPSTLKFVELCNDIDKYFLIYQEQIEQQDQRIQQQDEQIKEIKQMLNSTENNLNMKNELFSSQYMSNQMYYEKEEMLLKLNQNLEQNYTNRMQELKQTEELNNKEIDEYKRHINNLNKQIIELKEKQNQISSKKQKVDQSTQISMIIMNQPKKTKYKLQKYIGIYPSPFRFSTNCSVAIINSIYSDKVKDDYTCFISKMPYEPLYRYTATWFMKQFGQYEVASAFLNDFFETIKEASEKDRQVELFCSLIGMQKTKREDFEYMRANQSGNSIQHSIKQIALQSNLFYQIYYDIAATYRKKLEEKCENFNRPYFIHNYKKDEEIALQKGQSIVSQHLKQFLQDQDELNEYLEQFMRIELTQHVYQKTFKIFNYQTLKQNQDLIQGSQQNQQTSLQQQLQQQIQLQLNQTLKNQSTITTSLINISQFVIDSVANIESERLLQFIYTLKTAQLEKLQRQLSVNEYIEIAEKFYPVKNKQFYYNTFAEYCLTDVLKIFETSDEAEQIKHLETFTSFVIDFRTQDTFYAQVEGQKYESPSTSPHSPKRLKHTNSFKSFSHIKLENTVSKKNSQIDYDSISKKNFYSKQLSQQGNSLNVTDSDEDELPNLQLQLSPSKRQSSQVYYSSQKPLKSATQSPRKSSPSSPKRSSQLNLSKQQSINTPKKLGIVQSMKRYDSLSPSQRSQKNQNSPIRSQQKNFFSTRILYRQEFENKAIDAFFKQHLNTFSHIDIIEEKEQQLEERIKKTHDSFKYYLATAKNQPYVTTNYVARHDFIQYIMNSWEELRTMLRFLTSAFPKQQNKIKKR